MTGSGLSKGPHSGAGAPPRRKDEAEGAGGLPQSRVRAAGGVVWRRVPSGIEVVLVHRPAYDDWALPKGKAEGDETDEQTALHEVREETGLTCRRPGASRAPPTPTARVTPRSSGIGP